jgi:AAA domain, putative AbiEii toxin, Type IV TA system
LTLEKFYFRNPKIGAHLTAFREEAALTESVVWLKDKLLRSLSSPKTDNLKTNNSKTDDSETDDPTLTALIDFINHDGLLPEGFKLEKLTPDGLFFKVPKSNGLVHLYELSEGIKSVMSLTLELLRLLLDVYTPAVVFGNFLDKNQVEKSTQVNGVVLIDEIDVHLHPTWQTRIGQWFTSCFPNIQFIVTTHSPLICRAAVKGSVWQLPPPKSNQKTRRIEGAELHQLLYGDVLDAFSTGVFGESVTRSAAGHAKLERLAELNIRYYRQEASASELAERQILLDLFPANDSLFAQ